MNTPLVRYQHNLASGIVVCLLVGLDGIVPCGAFAAPASTQKARKTPAVAQKSVKPVSSVPVAICTEDCKIPAQTKPVAQKTAPQNSGEPVYSVVSPLGDQTVKMIPMSPRLKTLEGKTVGMYWNHSFKADITFPVIEEALKSQYPGIKIAPYTEIDAAIRAAGGEVRSVDAATLRKVFQEKGYDAVISGNGGCGVCTPRAARAVIEAEKVGIPGVVVTAPGFDKQARAVGFDDGVPSLQVALYPGPFDLHSKAQLQENAKKIIVPQIIQSLTKPITATATVERTRETAFTGSLDAINRHFADKQWSDGLAIVPPTVGRIREFLKYTGYAPDEEIAVLPGSNLKATPWNIAANAVMAGCRPEHMPILIGAVQAIADPSFRLTMTGGSTQSFVNFYIVNGPLGRQLRIDHGQGLVANPTNQVIGRAMGLIERNIAGYRIGETQMGSFGKTQSWVLAEDEEVLNKIGWQPYSVEKGFANNNNVNTVAAASSTLWGQNLIPSSSDPKTVMELLAYGVTHGESFGSGMIDSRKYLLVTPSVAEVLAAGGYTKRSLISDVAQNARRITYEWTFSKVYGSSGRVVGSFDSELAKNLREPGAEQGKLPPWYPKSPGWEEIVTTPTVSPGRLQILVCGDPNRNKAQTLAGGMGGAIKEIRLPANWDELMKKAGYRPLREFSIGK